MGYVAKGKRFNGAHSCSVYYIVTTVEVCLWCFIQVCMVSEAKARARAQRHR